MNEVVETSFHILHVFMYLETNALSRGAVQRTIYTLSLPFKVP